VADAPAATMHFAVNTRDDAGGGVACSTAQSVQLVIIGVVRCVTPIVAGGIQT
jgi:hypothetical protein